jgi:hypothetical protein
MTSALAKALLTSLGLASDDEIAALEQSDPTPAAELAADVLQHAVSIPAAVRRVIAALLLGQLERKDANTILFALQTLLVSERATQPCSSQVTAATAVYTLPPASTSTLPAGGAATPAGTTQTAKKQRKRRRAVASTAHSAKAAAPAKRSAGRAVTNE